MSKYIQILAGKNLIVAGCNLKIGDVVGPDHPRYAQVLRAIPLAAAHVAQGRAAMNKRTRILVCDEAELLDVKHQTLEDRFPNLNKPDPSELLAIERRRNEDLAHGVPHVVAEEEARMARLKLEMEGPQRRPQGTVSQPRVIEAPEKVQPAVDPEADLDAAEAAEAPVKRKGGRPRKEAAADSDDSPKGD
jgi:hypothetical protein